VNRKGLIFFLTSVLLIAFLFVGRSLVGRQAEQELPWELPIPSVEGSSANKTRALKSLEQSTERLKAFQGKLGADPDVEIADLPKEDLTKDHVALEEVASGSYPDMEEVLKSFEVVRSRWSAQAERNLADEAKPRVELPRLPSYRDSTYRSAAGAPVAEEYRNLYAKLYREYREKEDASSREWESRTLGDFEDLLTLHRLRSIYLTTIVEQLGHDRLFELTPDRWKTMALEMRLIRLRYQTFLTVKKATFRQKMHTGVAGWLDIFSQAGQLAIALLLPIAFFLLLRVVSRWLISSQEARGRFNPTVHLVLQVLPELGALLVLAPAEQSLSDNIALMELAVIPGVARYVIYYRVGAQLARAFGYYVVRGLPQKVQSSIHDKIEMSIKILVGSFVGFRLILFFVYFAIGRALIYWQFDSILIWVTVFAFVLVSWIWKPLLPALAFSTLGTPFRKRVKVIENSPFGWLLAPFVLVLILGLSLFFEVASFGRRFEWFNELLATLFRHRVKTSTVSVHEVPEIYSSLFREATVNEENRSFRQAYGKMEEIVQEFVTLGRSSQTVVLSGPRGAGRAAIIERLREEYGDTVGVSTLEFKTRISTESELVACVAQELLETEVETIEELIEKLETVSSRLVIVRQGHNLFLSRVGGFEATRALARVMSLPNLLFCLSFEPHCWRYLQGALPDVASDLAVIELQRLLPKEIQGLILERHAATGFELLYDSSLLGIGFDSNDFSNQESAFFQLLWDTSEGVPGIAADVWLASLELVEENVVRARIPHRFGPADLEFVRRDALFLLAALYRHETLTTEEASMVTDLPFRLTEQIFSVGVQRTFLDSTPEGFRVNSFWYASLARLLRRKNYLYGR
jgi:uncharacterized membrane protein YoaK (UPF0700 family)